MKDTLSRSLYQREIRDLAVRSKTYRQLYSDRHLIDRLDIVNELDGHSGCVNALSWSRSGNLLASGSDDQHLSSKLHPVLVEYFRTSANLCIQLLVHTYQPDDASEQFKFTTTVATGHTQNIFSVKFMPSSDDRTVITCAGDGEVRVFDLEYAGPSQNASRASSMATNGRRARRGNVYDGVRYLSDGDTNSRVYRSHHDRVKRIVTESSPHLFLTCSEDGEVRQWDLRQPSSAYPAPTGDGLNDTDDDSVPPPLISYRRYRLDLNSISCSATQPHYIALGGAHLHAFLHDRRMTGRDKLREAGKNVSSARARSSSDDELMGEATQCVRKFAPKGEKKMNRTDSGHITAIKISDARPNEMIASWSGDHVYSFDLNGAHAEETIAPLRSSNGKVMESRDRKRKRKANGSESSLAAAGSSSSRSRRTVADGSASLRIRYQNGQSEDIPLRAPHVQENDLTARERGAYRLAKDTVKIRTSLFSSDFSFSSALSQAASVLSTIDDSMSDWRYPMDPPPEMVVMQQTLRSNRESTRRLVQAAGTVARVLGGRLQTTSATHPMLPSFTEIETRTNDIPPLQQEQFGYDFLKAILLWLESGVGKLIEGFTRPAGMASTAKAARRLPILESEASTESIDDTLIPYLLQLASEKPVVDVTTNRFETDERRQLCASEKAAVHAFAAAVRLPFADLSSAVEVAEGSEQYRAQDRAVATRYWASKVARGVLLNAAEGVDFSFVSRAFGGSGMVVRELAEEEDREATVQGVEMLDSDGATVDGANADDVAEGLRQNRERQRGSSTRDQDEDMPDAQQAAQQSIVEDEDEDDNDENDYVDADEFAQDSSDDDAASDAESSDASEEDGVPNTGASRLMLGRNRLRDSVGRGIPCTAATRSFRGHCNVKTVKDVNYFGPNDEFVVSGSDDGNLFIWDAKTSELVNLLQGDGEVVNVVQGHPYETMLAVSGIDHTVKIFSPDGRARTAARLGQGVNARDPSTFSSLSWPSRRRMRRQESETADTTSEPAVPRSSSQDNDGNEDEDESYVAPNGLASRRRMHDAYRIMNQNDVDRQGGGSSSDAFLTRALLREITRRIQTRREDAGATGAAGEEENEEMLREVLGEERCGVQ